MKTVFDRFGLIQTYLFSVYYNDNQIMFVPLHTYTFFFHRIQKVCMSLYNQIKTFEEELESDLQLGKTNSSLIIDRQDKN